MQLELLSFSGVLDGCWIKKNNEQQHIVNVELRNLEDQRATSQRERHSHRMIIWLTGLSSAGKSTLAQALCGGLRARNHNVEILDGDAIRHELCKDLGFSKADRDENIRRIGFVANLLARHNVIVIVAAISPYRALRDEVREHSDGFIEVYVNAPLEVCEQRDVKGLYRKARTGELAGFTGIDDPYEPPLSPEIECRTDLESIEESAGRILRYIENYFTET